MSPSSPTPVCAASWAGVQACNAVLGAHRHEVRRGALPFPGVLDDHDAIGGLGHFGEQRIPQRGLLEPLAMLNIPMGYGLGKGTSRAPTRIEIRPDGTILRHDGAIQAP